LRRDRYRTFRAARVGDAEKDGEEEEENGARHGFEKAFPRSLFYVATGTTDFFQKVKEKVDKKGRIFKDSF